VRLRDGTDLFAQAIILAQRAERPTVAVQSKDRSSSALLLCVKGVYRQMAAVNYLMAAQRQICVYASSCGDSAPPAQQCHDLIVSSRPATRPQELIEELEHRWGLRDLRRRIIMYQPAAMQEDRGICVDVRGWMHSPPRRNRNVRGLYHSGGQLPLVSGVAGALLSGVRVAECLIQDHRPHSVGGTDRLGNPVGLRAFL